jgi:hypothetical protein
VCLSVCLSPDTKTKSFVTKLFPLTKRSPNETVLQSSVKVEYILLLTYFLTPCSRPSCEASRFSECQEISRILCNPKVCPAPVHFLSQIKPVHTTHPTSKSVPFTTAWGVLMLRKEERPAIWRVAGNILNKQSQRGDKAWSCNLGFGGDVNKSSL